ncbi:hypothetical protein BLNAU_6951 [Blattamonas nauphoetae]|uniref:Chorein N-terminal domain-containing protein n=1 Tax=Blattamonas nauphoetae TaxID=2049346 RepID=A0ABQ9Y2S9_9EUKA|nr:hypothetical protein BLNAU_6951 [Blattamonas nauphoetae]
MISTFIGRYIQPYLKDYNPDKMKISLMTGEIDMREVELNTAFLHSTVPMPFLLEKVQCNRITGKIPISLRSKDNARIEIDQVVVNIALEEPPKNLNPEDMLSPEAYKRYLKMKKSADEALAKKIHEEEKKKLKEEKKQKKSSSSKLKHSEVEKEDETSGLPSFVEKLIQHATVVINDLHVFIRGAPKRASPTSNTYRASCLVCDVEGLVFTTRDEKGNLLSREDWRHQMRGRKFKELRKELIVESISASIVTLANASRKFEDPQSKPTRRFAPPPPPPPPSVAQPVESSPRMSAENWLDSRPKLVQTHRSIPLIKPFKSSIVCILALASKKQRKETDDVDTVVVTDADQETDDFLVKTHQFQKMTKRIERWSGFTSIGLKMTFSTIDIPLTLIAAKTLVTFMSDVIHHFQTRDIKSPSPTEQPADAPMTESMIGSVTPPNQQPENATVIDFLSKQRQVYTSISTPSSLFLLSVGIFATARQANVFYTPISLLKHFASKEKRNLANNVREGQKDCFKDIQSGPSPPPVLTSTHPLFSVLPNPFNSSLSNTYIALGHRGVVASCPSQLFEQSSLKREDLPNQLDSSLVDSSFTQNPAHSLHPSLTQLDPSLKLGFHRVFPHQHPTFSSSPLSLYSRNARIWDQLKQSPPNQTAIAQIPLQQRAGSPSFTLYRVHPLINLRTRSTFSFNLELHRLALTSKRESSRAFTPHTLFTQVFSHTGDGREAPVAPLPPHPPHPTQSTPPKDPSLGITTPPRESAVEPTTPPSRSDQSSFPFAGAETTVSATNSPKLSSLGPPSVNVPSNDANKPNRHFWRKDLDESGSISLVIDGRVAPLHVSANIGLIGDTLRFVWECVRLNKELMSLMDTYLLTPDDEKTDSQNKSQSTSPENSPKSTNSGTSNRHGSFIMQIMSILLSELVGTKVTKEKPGQFKLPPKAPSLSLFPVLSQSFHSIMFAFSSGSVFLPLISCFAHRSPFFLNSPTNPLFARTAPFFFFHISGMRLEWTRDPRLKKSLHAQIETFPDEDIMSEDENFSNTPDGSGEVDTNDLGRSSSFTGNLPSNEQTRSPPFPTRSTSFSLSSRKAYSTTASSNTQTPSEEPQSGTSDDLVATLIGEVKQLQLKMWLSEVGEWTSICSDAEMGLKCLISSTSNILSTLAGEMKRKQTVSSQGPTQDLFIPTFGTPLLTPPMSATLSPHPNSLRTHRHSRGSIHNLPNSPSSKPNSVWFQQNDDALVKMYVFLSVKKLNLSIPRSTTFLIGLVADDWTEANRVVLDQLKAMRKQRRQNTSHPSSSPNLTPSTTNTNTSTLLKPEPVVLTPIGETGRSTTPVPEQTEGTVSDVESVISNPPVSLSRLFSMNLLLSMEHLNCSITAESDWVNHLSSIFAPSTRFLSSRVSTEFWRKYPSALFAYNIPDIQDGFQASTLFAIRLISQLIVDEPSTLMNAIKQRQATGMTHLGESTVFQSSQMIVSDVDRKNADCVVFEIGVKGFVVDCSVFPLTQRTMEDGRTMTSFILNGKVKQVKGIGRRSADCGTVLTMLIGEEDEEVDIMRRAQEQHPNTQDTVTSQDQLSIQSSHASYTTNQSSGRSAPILFKISLPIVKDTTRSENLEGLLKGYWREGQAGLESDFNRTRDRIAGLKRTSPVSSEKSCENQPKPENETEKNDLAVSEPISTRVVVNCSNFVMEFTDQMEPLVSAILVVLSGKKQPAQPSEKVIVSNETTVDIIMKVGNLRLTQLPSYEQFFSQKMHVSMIPASILVSVDPLNSTFISLDGSVEILIEDELDNRLGISPAMPKTLLHIQFAIPTGFSANTLQEKHLYSMLPFSDFRVTMTPQSLPVLSTQPILAVKSTPERRSVDTNTQIKLKSSEPTRIRSHSATTSILLHYSSYKPSASNQTTGESLSKLRQSMIFTSFSNPIASVQNETPSPLPTHSPLPTPSPKREIVSVSKPVPPAPQPEQSVLSSPDMIEAFIQHQISRLAPAKSIPAFNHFPLSLFHKSTPTRALSTNVMCLDAVASFFLSVLIDGIVWVFGVPASFMIHPTDHTLASMKRILHEMARGKKQGENETKGYESLRTAMMLPVAPVLQPQQTPILSIGHSASSVSELSTPHGFTGAFSNHPQQMKVGGQIEPTVLFQSTLLRQSHSQSLSPSPALGISPTTHTVNPTLTQSYTSYNSSHIRMSPPPLDQSRTDIALRWNLARRRRLGVEEVDSLTQSGSKTIEMTYSDLDALADTNVNTIRVKRDDYLALKEKVEALRAESLVLQSQVQRGWSETDGYQLKMKAKGTRTLFERACVYSGVSKSMDEGRVREKKAAVEKEKRMVEMIVQKEKEVEKKEKEERKKNEKAERKRLKEEKKREDERKKELKRQLKESEKQKKEEQKKTDQNSPSNDAQNTGRHEKTDEGKIGDQLGPLRAENESDQKLSEESSANGRDQEEEGGEEDEL